LHLIFLFWTDKDSFSANDVLLGRPKQLINVSLVENIVDRRVFIDPRLELLDFTLARSFIINGRGVLDVESLLVHRSFVKQETAAFAPVIGAWRSLVVG
jgi:hypothetical protein